MFQVSKAAGAIRTYRLKWRRALIEVWLPGEDYTAGDYVRPTRSTGFEYECTDGGETHADEPPWPETVGGTVVDGSVEWTCREPGVEAVDTIAAQVISADAGLTVDSQSFNTTESIWTLSGGTVGVSYDVSILVTLTSGDKLAETFRVTITE